MGVQPGVSVGRRARLVAVGTGQQHLSRAAEPQQPQQHQNAVAALGIGGGEAVIVDDRRALVSAQVARQNQRAGVGGVLIKALGVGEERIVRLDKLRHKVGRDGHVSLCRRHGRTACLGGKACAGGQHPHGFPRKGGLQGSQRGSVVGAAVLVLGVERISVGGVKHSLFVRRDGRQDVVDVAVRQIALAKIMFGIVTMQIELGRQEVGRGVAPGALALDGRNVVLDGVH